MTLGRWNSVTLRHCCSADDRSGDCYTGRRATLHHHRHRSTGQSSLAKQTRQYTFRLQLVVLVFDQRLRQSAETAENSQSHTGRRSDAPPQSPRLETEPYRHEFHRSYAMKSIYLFILLIPLLSVTQI